MTLLKNWPSFPAAALAVGLALSLGVAGGQEAGPPAPDAPARPAPRAPDPETASIAIKSEPAGAAVYILPSRAGPPEPLSRDRLVGRTPLVVRRLPGAVDVVVAREGYVPRVEPVELRSGSDSSLEVKLARDVEIPRGLSLKGSPRLVGTAQDAEALFNRVLASVIQLHVDEKDPRVLIDAAVRSTVQTLDAVRARGALQKRELSAVDRTRLTRAEVDLAEYPPLVLEEREHGGGRRSFKLSTGTDAVEGVTEAADPESFWRKARATVAFVKKSWDTRGVLDDSMLARCLIEGLLGALDDPHTHFFPPDAVRDFDAEAHGTFGGIGVIVAIRDGRLTVLATIDGTPSAQAGLLPHDRLVAIDKKPTDGLALADAVARLRGPPESKLELQLERGGAPARTVELVRAAIKMKATKRRLVRKAPGAAAVGYVRIASFMPEDVEREVEAHVVALEGEGARGLVLDLRNNPGGLLEQAVRVADLFIEEGSIVTTRARAEGHSRALLATRDVKKHRLPIAVLVNDGTASASEVLAGALRERTRAVLVGETTFGKGSVQRVVPLDPFDSALALTIATYHLPSGVTPHRRGLEPDVVVKLAADEKARLVSRTVYDEDEVPDRQLDAALEALAKRLK